MKKNKIGILVITTILVLAFLGGIFLSIDFFNKDNVDKSKITTETDVILYFLNTSKSDFVTEKQTINTVSFTSPASYIEPIVNLLIEGPKSTSAIRSIPFNTRILSSSLDGTVALINFSKEFLSSSADGDILTSLSIVKTLCEIPGIDRVRIMVEGADIVGISGKPLGAVSKEDLATVPSKDEYDKTAITLYFLNISNGSGYIKEERMVNVKKGDTVEKYIITELQKGPSDTSIGKVIPAEAKLLSIETKNKTCFVNFSSEFIAKHWGGTSGESMTISSIVKSLCELSSIDTVQFLIDGKKVDEFGHFVFSEPFDLNNIDN